MDGVGIEGRLFGRRAGRVGFGMELGDSFSADGLTDLVLQSCVSSVN